MDGTGVNGGPSFQAAFVAVLRSAPKHKRKVTRYQAKIESSGVSICALISTISFKSFPAPSIRTEFNDL